MGKPWENCGKPQENHRKTMGKAWDNCGKPWDSCGKPWETIGKPQGNYGKGMGYLWRTNQWFPIKTILSAGFRQLKLYIYINFDIYTYIYNYK